MPNIIAIPAIPDQSTTGPAFPVPFTWTPAAPGVPVLQYADGGTVTAEAWNGSQKNAAITLSGTGSLTATDSTAVGSPTVNATATSPASTNSSVTTLTLSSLTIAAGATSLLVFVVWGEPVNIPTSPLAKWDNAGTPQTMTLIASIQSSVSTNVLTNVYGLVSPTIGNKNLTVTWTGACPCVIDAIAFNGTPTSSVAAAFPHSATNHNTTGSPTVTVTSANGNLTAAAVGSASSQTLTGLTATSSTSIFINNQTLFNAGAARAPSTGTSVVFTAAPASTEWGMVGVDVAGLGASVAYHPAFATPGFTTGKLYWETVETVTDLTAAVGIGNTSSSTTTGQYLGVGTDTIGWRANGQVWNGGAQVATWAAPGLGTAIVRGHALDLVNNKYWGRVGAAGNWNNAGIASQNPATNTGGLTVPSGVFAHAVVPGVSTALGTDTVTGSFASSSWVGTIPSGFTALTSSAGAFASFPAGSTFPVAPPQQPESATLMHPPITAAGTVPITIRDATGASATANVVVAVPAGGLVTSPDQSTLTSTSGTIIDAHSPTKVTWSLRPTWALLSSTSGVLTTTGASSSINTTGADLVVVGVSQYAGSSIATLSDSKGNTWTPLTAKTGPLPAAYIRLYYARGGTFGTSHTFTLTASGSFYASIFVLAFAGSSASPFDVENGATTGSATSLSTGSITPSLDNALIISAGCFANGTLTPYNVTSLTRQAQIQFLTAVNEGGAIAWAQQNPAAAINPSWSWTTSAEAAAVIAAFKVGAGASGLQVYRDGVLDTNTANVQLLLWFGGNMYREEGTSAPFSWLQYTGSGGNPWTAIAGDPRTGTTTPVVTGITLSNASVAAGAPAGTVVGNIVVAVSSGNFTGTFQPLTGTDAAKFQIVGSQLQTTQALTTGGSPYSINITTLMNGGTFTSPAIAITATAAAGTVTDINLTNMTITAGLPSGTVVANIVVTVSNPVAYTLALSGAQASLFSINSAQQLVTASSLSAAMDAITITATF